MIILIGGEKGGTGKSTISTNIAAIHAQSKDVLLVDTDKQETSNLWAATREENEVEPRVACVQKFGRAINKELLDLKSRYDDIIVDAGGRDSVELRSAMTVADCLYVPIIASQFDVWTLEKMEELINLSQSINKDLQTFIIINKASPNPAVKESLEASEILKDFDCFKFPGMVIRERIVYRKAAATGMSVTEFNPPDHKASWEMKKLHSIIFQE